MDTIGKRVDYVRKENGLSYEQLAALVGGIKGDAIRKAISRNTLKPMYINLISDKLGVSRQWIETGEGEIPGIKPNDLGLVYNKLKNEVKQTPFEDFTEAEYLPVTAHAGYLASLEDKQDLELSTMLLPKEFEKGNYMVVEVAGDSMDDGTTRAICDGDKLLVKEIDSGYYAKKLPFRQSLFVIASREGIVCKQISNHDVENRTITCHSFNSLHPDYTIKLDDVFGLYFVKKLVDRRIKF